MPSFSEQNKTQIQVITIWNYRAISTTDLRAKQIDNSYYKNKDRKMPGMKRCFRRWNFAENLSTFKGHFKHRRLTRHSTRALNNLYICCSEKRCNVEWGAQVYLGCIFYSSNQRIRKINIPKRHSLLINNQQITESRLTRAVTVRV